ncbi:cell cycle protein GpsB [Halolactibacillus alkaliphilus]|uniref:Cell cycle protein GpsB n=1 Tax=Halolactibacillus alkaliphilus TaxID=442899 RepID=A0A511X141_9BACI|nr:cell division regulator GpsB [Halolactibacillus alkaliphilus]GEN56659.1 cell cycle protein GpsB [Halolactibacillus alkaliphilus]GGN70264.1 cell cycle protein GpsB [Halolactibacillus alkaliphilus]SFO77329.1 DivIVA domain-containing protein [Halolactibacillus alkaliphilus]
MENKHTQLSTKDILDKEFKTSMRGYNQEEVDAFLDIVIQDYEALESRIRELEEEQSRASSRKVEEPVRPRVQATNHQANYDILKRVSNLEKAVFGKKYADD